MNIAVASGKGGTGKTTIALSLARYIAHNGSRVAVLDCDVEEPNVNLFLGAAIERTERAGVPVPSVDPAACTGCGACERICAFSAIVLINERPLVLPDMCHSCGGCALVCPTAAITEVPKEIGDIEYGSRNGIDYAGGRLAIGGHLSPPLINQVKRAYGSYDVRILDCPPGTSCPVIEAARGADYLVLVTEPTPFGLNDLMLAVDMVRAMGLPFGVVINRDGMGNADLERWCGVNDVRIVARVPFDRRIAEEYSRGDCASRIIECYGEQIALVAAAIAPAANHDRGTHAG
ncbi:MAG TPA: ATP-binding protein [Spirochaetota bacterium]|nr:ATP-binding protein [Spirochaetota bacterium]HPU88961.1 ATP-binding protein [Spirochaetota bacterium]